MRSQTYLAQLLLESPTVSRQQLEDTYNKIHNKPQIGGVLKTKGMTDEALTKGIISGMENNQEYKTKSQHFKNDNERLAAIMGIASKKDFEPNPSDIEDGDDKPHSTSGTDTSGTSGTDDTNNPDVIMKKWPKYEEVRMKWYQKTCDMGWPKDIMPSTKFEAIRKGSIIYPWKKNAHTAYCFNPRGLGTFSIQNYTKRVKDALYTKFEHDVKGLKSLQSQVDAILEQEKMFFHGRPIRRFMTAILGAAFKGIGGTSNDTAMFKWLVSKVKGMTIFEYQKYILDEMVSKMSLDDTTLQELKDILYPLRNRVIKAMRGYEPSAVKGEYVPRLGFICAFKIESKQKNRDTLETQAFMDMLRDVIKPISEGEDVTNKFDESPTVGDLDALFRKIEKMNSGDKRPQSETILKAIPKLEFVKFKSKDEEKTGAYKILFKYMPYRAIVQVIYSPKDEWDE